MFDYGQVEYYQTKCQGRLHGRQGKESGGGQKSLKCVTMSGTITHRSQIVIMPQRVERLTLQERDA